MKRRQRRQIESTLAPRYRGVAGYRTLLDDVTLRVSVTGVRGKSALTRMAAQTLQERGLRTYAKVTGTDPVSILDGDENPIERDPRNKAILGETYWEVKKHWPFDAMVLENQAVTPYTMRVFNRLYAKPHYVLLTNIRRDHQGDLGRSSQQMARAFAHSCLPGSVLISGERDPSVQEELQRACRSRRVRFIDAAPATHIVPGYESVQVLDAMLVDWLGVGLAQTEKAATMRRLEGRFQWRPSALPGVRWFHGAEINDVDSTRIVLEHLRRQQNVPVIFVAYLRRDRVDRTSSFIPFLADQLRMGDASKILLVGHRASTVARRLKQWHRQVVVLPDKMASVQRALDLIQADGRGQAVMTIANAVPPWPREFAKRMEVAGMEPCRGPDEAILTALFKERVSGRSLSRSLTARHLVQQ